MDINIKEYEELLENSKNKKVRYRLNGDQDFQNDILEDYKIQDNDIKIILRNSGTIETPNVAQISVTEYDDRTDSWMYSTGNIANRFNLYK